MTDGGKYTRHMYRLAPEVILELESFGLPFHRTSEGPAGRSNPGLRGRACDDQDSSLLLTIASATWRTAD